MCHTLTNGRTDQPRMKIYLYDIIFRKSFAQHTKKRTFAGKVFDKNEKQVTQIINQINNTAMKKLFSLFLAAGAMVALVSCDPQNSVEEGNANFEITVSNVKATTASVAVKPAADNFMYYFDMVSEKDLKEYASKEAYADSLITFMKEFVDAIIESGLGDDYGVSDAKDILSQGKDGYDFTDLDPETKYFAIAFKVNAETFKPEGKVAFKDFTTTAIQKSNNVITFAQDADNKALIHINATNNDTYYWGLIEKDTLQAYYGGNATEYMGDLIAYMDEIGYLSYFISNGSEEYITSEEITEPALYVFMAVGLEGTVMTTDVFTAEIDVTKDMCGTEEEEAGVPRRIAGVHATKSLSKRFALK